MKHEMIDTPGANPQFCEIRLKGHLEARWIEWFDGLAITLDENGNTLLSGPVADQAALHGLLKKVRDVGLPLLSINSVEPRANRVKEETNMKTLQKVGGISALICAGTFILAMGLAATTLAPMTNPSLPFDQLIEFFLPHQTLVFIWHFCMYLVNGAFLALLILALTQRLKTSAPAMALAAACFGLLWTGMVFASGFITLYGWEVIGRLSATDPAQATMLRLVLDTITIGIDHSDRYLGCLWVLLTSWAALRTGQLSRPVNIFGLVIGFAGIVSSVAPALNELGYAFGLGVIVWWIWLGIVLLRINPGKTI